ncbi:hypothetical protein GOV05_02895 [Candidatus Woesearchaeota archaeon]|nr:hypothetical protein [Candidatus Woesearchaeota archaeon]
MIFKILISLIISLFVLVIGYFLARVTRYEKEELRKAYSISLTTVFSASIFIAAYILGGKLLYIFLLTMVVAAGFTYLSQKTRIILSLTFFFLNAIILSFVFDEFLLGLNIILGFLISTKLIKKQ